MNFMMEEEGDERIKASYRDNYTRLAAIKSTYDPANFFRVNQNIKPLPYEFGSAFHAHQEYAGQAEVNRRLRSCCSWFTLPDV